MRIFHRLQYAFRTLAFDLVFWCSQRSWRDADLPACFVLMLLAVGEMTVPQPAPGVPVEAALNLFVQVAIMIVSALISYALAPKPPKPKPAALQDFDVPMAEEGRPICVVFGEVLIKDPTVVWYGDLASKAVKKKAKKK